jgi:hypothetical protein
MSRTRPDIQVNRMEFFQGDDYPADPTMSLTAEQLQTADLIDARVRTIAQSGADDLAIFANMADCNACCQMIYVH